VTGGGQTFASADVQNGTVKGPGDTITFQASINNTGVDNTATGAVNIIDRTAGAGGKGEHFKGVVDCTFLAASPAPGTDGGYVELHGHGIKDDADQNFVVRIQDNGQGADSTDLVEFKFSSDQPACDDKHQNDPFATTLARGNAKIHKQNPSTSKSTTTSAPASTTKLGIAGL
jgi:hypothetical protein